MDNPWKTSEQQDESGKEGVDLGPGGVFKIFEVKEETRRLTLEEETKCGRISEISAEMKRSGEESGKEKGRGEVGVSTEETNRLLSTDT